MNVLLLYIHEPTQRWLYLKRRPSSWTNVFRKSERRFIQFSIYFTTTKRKFEKYINVLVTNVKRDAASNNVNYVLYVTNKHFTTACFTLIAVLFSRF